MYLPISAVFVSTNPTIAIGLSEANHATFASPLAVRRFASRLQPFYFSDPNPIYKLETL
jgi:hypothetical protein